MSPEEEKKDDEQKNEQKLNDAIVENDLVSVTALLDDGADVSDVKNVLQPACEWDRVEMLQLFDARGADLLNAVSRGLKRRDTLLHICSIYGAVKCANFLLSKGIDHNKMGHFNKSSLDICRGGGYTQAIDPSPGRKEIEKLILSKMSPEEKKR